ARCPGAHLRPPRRRPADWAERPARLVTRSVDRRSGPARNGPRRAQPAARPRGRWPGLGSGRATRRGQPAAVTERSDHPTDCLPHVPLILSYFLSPLFVPNLIRGRRRTQRSISVLAVHPESDPRRFSMVRRPLLAVCALSG